jgi:adenine-specific DNA-methyltransferase
MASPAVYNYIGSKNNLLHFIQRSIEDYTGLKLGCFASVMDPFCGTGAVSHLFLKNGIKHALSNDVQYYSYIMSSSFVKSSVNTKKIKKFIAELNSLDETLIEVAGFIEQNYTPRGNRMYFTIENGRRIDMMRQNIEVMHSKSDITQSEYRLLLKLLLHAVIRCSNVTCVYESYLKKWKPSAKTKLMLDDNLDMFLVDTQTRHESCNKDIFQLLNDVESKSYEVCFLDPPYCGRRYDTNYYILETIMRNDNPMIRGATGLRSEERKTLFVHKGTALGEFDKLFQNIKSRYVFMCYSSEGILTKAQVTELMSKYYSNVKCYEFQGKRIKTNNNVPDPSKSVTEYIFAATSEHTQRNITLHNVPQRSGCFHDIDMQQVLDFFYDSCKWIFDSAYMQKYKNT